MATPDKRIYRRLSHRTFDESDIVLENCLDCVVTGDRVTLVRCTRCTVKGKDCIARYSDDLTVEGENCSMYRSSMAPFKVGSASFGRVKVQSGVARQSAGSSVVNTFHGSGFTTIVRNAAGRAEQASKRAVASSSSSEDSGSSSSEEERDYAAERRRARLKRCEECGEQKCAASETVCRSCTTPGKRDKPKKSTETRRNEEAAMRIAQAFGVGAVMTSDGRINIVSPGPAVNAVGRNHGTVTNVEGRNSYSQTPRGVFVNGIQVPEGTSMSQGVLFYKGKVVKRTDAKLFDEFPSLLMALESIKPR